MIYEIIISENLDKKFKKLIKKNKKQLKIISKKIKQIQNNPYHFKSLKFNMKRIRRVHIDNSFVLTYEIIEKTKIIKLLDYEHHDNIY